MASDETGLPDTFDPATGRNVKWVAELGSQSYATPVVAGGRVLIGTNNDSPRDPRHRGDRARAAVPRRVRRAAALAARRAQALGGPRRPVPRLAPRRLRFAADRRGRPRLHADQPRRGRLPRHERHGRRQRRAVHRRGAAHGPARRDAAVEPAANDADILWVCDLVEQVGIRTHDQVQGSVLIHGDLLYVNSCNGVDGTHRKIPSPDAPSLVVLDKRTGRIVARDGLRLGPKTFHVNWSAPSLGGRRRQRPRIFFGGGDGVCYAFEPVSARVAGRTGSSAQLKDVWRFDPDPTAPKQDVHRWVGNRREGPERDHGHARLRRRPRVPHRRRRPVVGQAAGVAEVHRRHRLRRRHEDRRGLVLPAAARDLLHARRRTTAWSSSPTSAAHVHCVDAATGKPHWTHKAVGEFWASPLVADGKVYVGTRRGQFVVLAAAPEKRLIAKVDLDEPVNGTAVGGQRRALRADDEAPLRVPQSPVSNAHAGTQHIMWVVALLFRSILARCRAAVGRRRGRELAGGPRLQPVGVSGADLGDVLRGDRLGVVLPLAADVRQRGGDRRRRSASAGAACPCPTAGRSP